MAGTSLHRFYVMTPTMISPELSYVMAPINYAHNSGFPSVISCHAMDYIMSRKLMILPELFMYLILLALDQATANRNAILGVFSPIF